MFEDFLNLFLQGVTLPQQLHITGKTVRMRVIAIFHLLLLTAAEMGAGNRMDQVGPLTKTFCGCFLEKKILICLENQWPLIWEDIFSLSFFPATPLSGSWTFEGLYELRWRTSWALNHVSSLIPELQKCKGTITCSWLGAGGPGTP